MFLGVSGRVFGVDIQQELTDEEREVVAERLLAEQRERFDGVRKAAYTAAGVNPATWARATSGARVRPDRLVLIVKSLWPESHGNWSQVPESQRSAWREPDYSGPTWAADADDPWVSGQVALKAYVDESMSDVDSRFLELEQRVRDLERLVAEALDPDDEEQGGKDEGTGGTSAANTADQPGKQTDYSLGARNTGRQPRNVEDDTGLPPDPEGPEGGA